MAVILHDFDLNSAPLIISDLQSGDGEDHDYRPVDEEEFSVHGEISGVEGEASAGEHSCGTLIPLTSSTNGVDSHDILGMEFSSDGDAFEFYKGLGMSDGFSIKRGRSKVSTNLEIKYFFCNREGYPKGTPGERQRRRASFRCGCSAQVRFTVVDGSYKCTMHIREHNHPFIPVHQRHFMKAARNIDEGKKSMLFGLLGTGIKSVEAWRIMVQEAGGIESVGFTPRDMWNLLSKEKAKTARCTDAQLLLDYFVNESNNDVNFFFKYDVVEGRLNNFYWRDSIMLVDYNVFGDVVVFDTTYRTNMYGMVCCPFVGINNHGFTIIFGCGFLVDEKAETFGWLFDCFLAGVGGKQPTTFMTDQDKAMAIAVEKHLPQSKHRLCLWHITQNARKHLGFLLNKNADFEKAFYFCLYSCLSEEELLEKWREMVNTYELAGNEWLAGTLELRGKWCPTISADCFSAGILSTQRSESLNHMLGGICDNTHSLLSMVHALGRRIKEWRDRSNREDYRNQGTNLRKFQNLVVLRSVVKKYTLKSFDRFEKQVEGSHSLTHGVLDIDGDVTVYQVSYTSWDERKCIVRFVNTDPVSVTCSCRNFEQEGFLCRHALRVMSVNNVHKIPESYILRRWCKDARTFIPICSSTVDEPTHKLHSMAWRFNLMREFYEVAISCQSDESRMKLCDDAVADLKKKILSNGEAVPVDEATTSNIMEASMIGNPEVPAKKGRPKKEKRIKSSVEGGGKKKTKKQA